MADAKWSAAVGEATLSVSTNLDSKSNGATTFLCDIDNTTARSLYTSIWLELGSITPSAGGSVTLELRRKRGSTYADSASESKTQTPSSGASAKNMDFAMRLPGPHVYGLYWVNNLGVTSAGSSNAIHQNDHNETIA